ncbi:MAG TPA: lysozyme inhibitor LprI family protein [Candidatus Methylomirabilis sp.]|nr:lysozyme inhibitor LprI family protein [Candidatus Methylomirabilis sp.]
MEAWDERPIPAHLAPMHGPVIGLRASSRSAAVLAFSLLGLLCALGWPAHASAEDQPPRSATTARCENAQTTAAMRECELRRYQQADIEMTAAYQALMGQLDQIGRTKLRQAQRAWVKYRDAEADLQADAARGGTLAPLIRASALADLTESRREQLRKDTKGLVRAR